MIFVLFSLQVRFMVCAIFANFASAVYEQNSLEAR